ncbi:B2MG protein, partial [Alectura lathami]|nr:B2MG protein [Alectura lathami]
RRAVVVVVVALLALLSLGQAKSAPKVQVYSRFPVKMGSENVLNCYVEGFHPPKIGIALLKDGVPMEGVQYSDMSFNDDWTFQRLAHVPFTPAKDAVYACQVEHEAFAEPQLFRWGKAF